MIISLPECDSTGGPSASLPGGAPAAMEFRRIPAGTFRMGQRGGGAEEEPVHEVSIPSEFYLGVTPVTQGQYRAMARHCRGELEKIDGNLGVSPSHFDSGGDDCPVEQVSWDDARCVARWFSEAGILPQGWIADLPTEAQWEYACRGGTTTKYWSGNREQDLAEVAWYGANAGGKTHPVAEKDQPNRFGLLDSNRVVNVDWFHTSPENGGSCLCFLVE